MCDLVSRVASDPSLPASNRRQFLAALTGVTATAGLSVAGAGTAHATGPEASRSRGRRHRTRLVLLGTAGGPAVVGGERAGTSTAVAFGERTYLVDLGLGAYQRLRQSSLGAAAGPASLLNEVRALFVTHMHSDHLVDWPAVYATGALNATGRTAGPLAVRGPGRRGTLTRVFPPGRPEPAVYHPEDPTPGITAMTEHLTAAWAADFNDRARDSGFAGPQSLFDVQDIDLSGVWAIDPEGRPPRLSAPLPVWEDGEVRVTATLVDHHPTAPSFAYRFDTPDGSIVVSGDTTVSENLIDLARDVDYLVHEVVDPAWVERLVATLPAEIAGLVGQHLLESHTTIEQVGRDVAERAGAKNLVLTHLGGDAASQWGRARRGYSGRLVVGRDLMELGVG